MLRRWPLRGGVSADVQALAIALPEGGEREIVVRRHGASGWKPQEAGVTSVEYAVLGALHRAGLPVPEPLGLDLSGERLPGPYLVVDFVKGRAEPRDLEAGLVAMARFLVALHALDVASLELPDSFPVREDPIAELPQYLPDALTAVGRALSERTLAPVPIALLHGDFWPGNVLWQGNQIAAVLDWEDTALGDPACDLAGARVELTWKYGPDAAETFATAYREAGGPAIGAERLAVWELFVTAAGLAFMDRWGLEPQVEASMRERSQTLLESAASVLADGSGPVA